MLNRPAISIVAAKNQSGGEPCKGQIANSKSANLQICKYQIANLQIAKCKWHVAAAQFPREFFRKAAPYLKLLTGTLSLILPLASSAVKLALDEKSYKAIEGQLDLGKSIINATIGEGAKIAEFMGDTDTTSLEHGRAIRAQGGIAREFHALLKAQDPSFGGLVRVMNKRQEFLWVHERFETEY